MEACLVVDRTTSRPIATMAIATTPAHHLVVPTLEARHQPRTHLAVNPATARLAKEVIHPQRLDNTEARRAATVNKIISTALSSSTVSSTARSQVSSSMANSMANNKASSIMAPRLGSEVNRHTEAHQEDTKVVHQARRTVERRVDMDKVMASKPVTVAQQAMAVPVAHTAVPRTTITTNTTNTEALLPCRTSTAGSSILLRQASSHMAKVDTAAQADLAVTIPHSLAGNRLLQSFCESVMNVLSLGDMSVGENIESTLNILLNIVDLRICPT